MKILIDTHCWLWWHAEPERLNRDAHGLLSEPENQVLLSAVSSWEIAIKYALGKLSLPQPPQEYVPARLQSGAFSTLLITHAHTLRVATLPPHHRDPFDRLLIAQGQVEGLPVLTADARFCAYDVEILWAAKGPPPRARRTRRS